MPFHDSRTPTLIRLMNIEPVIQKICDISGTAGASIGVLHKGQILRTTNYGFRDIAAQLEPSSSTVYGIGSMTKAFVASGVGHLVAQGRLNWTTPIRRLFRDGRMPTLSLRI